MVIRPKGDDPWLVGIHHCREAVIYSQAMELFTAISNRMADGLTSFLVTRELRQSEARLRTIVDHAPDAITIFDIDENRYIEANPMAEVLFGMPSRDILTTPPMNFSPQLQPNGRPSLETVRQEIQGALDGKFPCFVWMQKNGKDELIPCEVRLAVLPHPNRKLIRSSMTDISKRKREENNRRELERQVSEQKDLLQTVLDNVPAGVALYDVNNRIVFVNKQITSEMNLKAEDFVGKLFSEMVAPREGVTLEDLCRQVLETGQPIYDYFIRGLSASGATDKAQGKTSYRYYRTTCIPIFNPVHRITGVLAVAEDETERKKTEDQERKSQKLETIGTLTAGLAHDFNNILGPIMGFADLALAQVPAHETLHGYLSRIINAADRASGLVNQILLFSKGLEKERVPLAVQKDN